MVGPLKVRHPCLPHVRCRTPSLCHWESLLMATEPWVSVEDVAKHLSVAKDSIYRWIEHKGCVATLADDGW